MKLDAKFSSINNIVGYRINSNCTSNICRNVIIDNKTIKRM